MDNQQTTHKKFPEAMKSHPIYRACLFFILPMFVSLLLGLSFFLIVNGILMGCVWLAPYFPSTFAFTRKVLAISSSSANAKSIPITWWRLPMLFIKSGVSLAMIYAGVVVLTMKGFLGQNIFWLMYK